MSTYPTYPRSAFVEWCASHAGVFQAQEGEIGLSKAQAVAFGSTTEKAEALLIEQAQAWERYLVASRRARDGVARLRREAGDCVRSIRAFAETTGDAHKIYASARIAPPKSPSPAAPPERPRRLAATLNATSGALTLTWTARDPNRRGGVTYLVRRRLPGEPTFTLLGATGGKTFVDDAPPAGLSSVEYSVQAQRGARSSAVSEILVVHFGKAEAATLDVRTLAGEPTSGTRAHEALAGEPTRGVRAKFGNLKTSKSQNYAPGLAAGGVLSRKF
ncbi:MAG TPA: hypothetical protein PK093_23875 [Phycisphaerae bacterium]|nr:hypothetical protein [Phycisphaerae bacterium]